MERIIIMEEEKGAKPILASWKEVNRSSKSVRKAARRFYSRKSGSSSGASSLRKRGRKAPLDPLTPPHKKRFRHSGSPRRWEVEMKTPRFEVKSGTEMEECNYEKKRGLMLLDENGTTPLLLFTISFLDRKDLMSLALCAKRMYIEPAIWQNYCACLVPSTLHGGLMPTPLPALDPSFSPLDLQANSNYYRRAARLRNSELAFVPSSGSRRGSEMAIWLEKNPSLRSRFFPILVNWLVDLHLEIFRLHSSRQRTALLPVHAAVKHLYMYLARVGNCESQGLQKVGVACYALAIRQLYPEAMLRKMDVNPSKFAYFTDEAYTPEEIQEATEAVAKALPKPLDSVPPPTAIEALDALLRSKKDRKDVGFSPPVLSPLVETLAFNIVDLSIHEDAFARELPSCVAAAAILAAVRIACSEGGGSLGIGAPIADTKRLAATCCAPVEVLGVLERRLLKLFFRAKKRETRQPMPFGSVSASFYWTVIDRYRRRLLTLATRDADGSKSTSWGDPRIRWVDL
ncbi:hypothetical protein AAMO2058_001286400 [Amorphochlora amoebiformis]|eukprot:1086317-Amorphochlora_amoeboformis.AAC.1